ncbi:hypothetical protein BBH99_19525 [Chryseobacterium contaminans]|uniref:DUF3592 domain-containing protein n=1 Tax=Chryseobacterium contaminans TaxID=1423959 RepID=A0A1M7EP09_9FLAO|nr:DUF3592 domain-containing protein [Chryseobacterium contaminans]OCA79233.1 hypothetical protein BBH99_19525 [Chryseobacterium contaminans]SHL93542.1 hypothetical protein SAMN05444407_107268 [Chryseobacterium contaminans]
MTFFGYFFLAIFLFSLYIAYRIFNKILKKRSAVKGKTGWLEKGFMLFFISLIVIALNGVTMVLSYSFFWEKAYRTLSEKQYEAVVIGYKKENISTKNFSTSGYYNKTVYFPKVRYSNINGREVIKTLDITNDHPPAIGQTLKITDNETNEAANGIELDWIMSVFGCIFTGLAAFFACLFTTYIKNDTFKKRIVFSLYAALFMAVLNVGCILLMVFKH